MSVLQGVCLSAVAERQRSIIRAILNKLYPISSSDLVLSLQLSRFQSWTTCNLVFVDEACARGPILQNWEELGQFLSSLCLVLLALEAPVLLQLEFDGHSQVGYHHLTASWLEVQNGKCGILEDDDGLHSEDYHGATGFSPPLWNFPKVLCRPPSRCRRKVDNAIQQMLAERDIDNHRDKITLYTIKHVCLPSASVSPSKYSRHDRRWQPGGKWHLDCFYSPNDHWEKSRKRATRTVYAIESAT